MDILERLKFISKISFDFDFEIYLAKESKSILVLKIDTINEKYSLISGVDDANILECINSTRFWYSLAGYRVNAHNHFRTNIPVDIFLVSDIIINSNPSHIDTIIIHELTHLLIDSENSHAFALLPHFKEMGLRLYYATDTERTEDTRHNFDFCQLLVYGCSNYQSKTKNFRGLQEAVENAMRYDTFRKFSLTD